MKRLVIVSSLLLPIVSGQALAERSWWQFWKDNGEAVMDQVPDAQGVYRFTPDQKRLLKDFLTGQQRSHDRDDDGRHERDDDHRGGKDKHDKGKKPKQLPPGLKKKLERGGQLPPGWQKKMARGEVVDAEVWRQSHHLPPDILRRMGHLPPDTELRYVEDKVYRVMRNTREIVDILGL